MVRMDRIGVISMLVVSLGAQAAIAQEECGLTMTPQEAATALKLHAQGAYDLAPGQAFAAGEPLAVSLSFHVVRQSNGSGGISDSQLSAALADANEAFAPAGVTFCLSGPADYIDDDNFYFNIDTGGEINALRQMNVVPDSINCYFTPNLSSESGGLCGISSFTFSGVQGIVMRNSCTGTSSNPSTFPHEIGHYFDLFHTHETAFGEECPNGSNCSFAGDQICDTPADPQLSGVVNGACQYVGNATACGQLFEPDPTNYMSYSPGFCRDNFSPLQNAKIFATLNNLRPNLIGGCSGPGLFELVEPVAGAGNVGTTPFLDWIPAQFATTYEVIVDDDSAFASPEASSQGVVSFYFVPDGLLEEDTRYYWRVTAINAGGEVESETRCFRTSGAFPTRLYVDADAADGGDGTSWATACNKLEDALAVAANLQDCATVFEVWLAEGTYLPSDVGDRSASFSLSSGTSIYGGFGGGETLLSQRDPAVNITVLSGDLLSNDDETPASRDDNSYHVVVAQDTGSGTRMDGVTIQGGNADAFGFDGVGGAVVLTDGSLTLSDVTVRDHRAQLGGGIATGPNSSTSDLTLTDVVVTDNYAAIGGGGLYFAGNGGIAATNVTCENNVTDGQGGAVSVVEGNLTGVSFSTSTFEGNSAAFEGGAVLIIGTVNSEFKKCRFYENDGGIKGGALLVRDSQLPSQLTQCAIVGNTALDGSAVALEASAMTLRSCTIAHNFATGSAISVSTFDAAFQTYNIVLWRNIGSTGAVETDQIAIGDFAAIQLPKLTVAAIDFSTVEGWSASLPGVNTTGNDPQFVHPTGTDAILGTSDDNLRLLSDSPAIDAGLNSEIEPLFFSDLDGLQRIVDGDLDTIAVTDHGAYEHQPDPCPADVGGSPGVDVFDLLLVLDRWGTCDSPCPPFCLTDTNQDCLIDVFDLLNVLSDWGPCP